MNLRRARREALLPTGTEIPVAGPRWARRIFDTGEEVLGVHADTGTTYALRLFHDLDEGASAAIVARRVLALGGTRAEVGRVLVALGLAATQRARPVKSLARRDPVPSRAHRGEGRAGGDARCGAFEPRALTVPERGRPDGRR